MQDIKHILREKGTALARLKRRKKALEALDKKLSSKIEKLEVFEIPKIMEMGEIENIKITNVGTLYTQTKPKVTVLAENKAAFFAWLREQGHGDIIKEDVHYQTLNSWAEEVLEQGTNLPELCKVFWQTKAVLRKG